MPDAGSIDLPSWAEASRLRREHIARVVRLLDRWAGAMAISTAEAQAWHDAGLFHDALRDAPEGTLRRLLDDDATPTALLHGPAAAARLRADGESRADVLDAVEHHTIGSAGWARTGQALYMADYLEPGRRFDAVGRASLAERVPEDFTRSYRTVVERRVAWALREGLRPHPKTLEILSTPQ